MPQRHNANVILQDVSQGLQSTMDKHETDAVVCVKRQTANIVNPFVMLFYENLENVIDEYNLSSTDIKVVLKLLKKMQFGNQINISFSAIAREAGIAKPNIYRTKKRLLASKLLIEIDECLYINPNIIAKGDYAETKSNDNNINLLNKTYDIIEDTTITPSILTKDIKERQRTKKKMEKNSAVIEELIQDKEKNIEPVFEEPEEDDLPEDILTQVVERNPLFKTGS